MATVDLNAGETDTFNKLDTVSTGKFDNALEFGVKNSSMTLIVDPLVGYSGFAIDLKKSVKSVFLSLFAAMMKGSDWVNVTFSGTWTQWSDTNFESVAYRKDGVNTVWLKGLAKSNGNNIGNSITTLPVGFRPTKNRIFSCIASDILVSIEIGSNGNITPRAGPTSDTWFSLDSISFPAQQ